MPDLDRTRILRFRLSRHRLDRRLSAGSLAEAVAVTGIQETSRRTAALALHARVTDVDPADLDHALMVDKSVLMMWAMRGAPYVVPIHDAAVFTTGARAVGESSLKTFFGGWAKSLSSAGVSLTELVEQAADAAYQVLDGRQLPVDELRHEIAAQVPQIRGLTPPSGAHADLPEPLFRAVGQTGVVCIVDSRRMTDAVLARTDQWLGRPPATLDSQGSRAELLRRFLRCHGPSTPRAFADWTTRSVSDVRDVFALIEPELVELSANGSTEFLLAADVDELKSPPEPTGVRLLPTRDPFMQQRDRERLVPDGEQRRRLWRPVGSPGLVLVDGHAGGVWTSRQNGKTLNITVEPFIRLSRSVREAIEEEAERIAPFRGAQRATLSVAD